MNRVTKLAAGVAIAMSFQCNANWYEQNPNAWLQAIQNTERASKRAQEKRYLAQTPKAKHSEVKAFELPADGPISSKFGMRLHPIHKKQIKHKGIDIAASRGEAIVSQWAGKVVRAAYNPTFGNVIEVDHGLGRLTRYAHADSINVVVGDKVNKGDKLGEVGSTGLATGPHLHFELIDNGRHVNPLYAQELLSSQETVVTRLAKAAPAKPKAMKKQQFVSVNDTVSKVNSIEQSNNIKKIKPAEADRLALINAEVTSDNKIKIIDTTLLATIEVNANDTVWSLAKKIRGEHSIYQALLSIYKLNPGVFINGNINTWKRGETVIIPSEEYISTISRNDGIAKMRVDNKRLNTALA